LITRDRPVGNKVTNEICQSGATHVQIHYTVTVTVYHRLALMHRQKAVSIFYALNHSSLCNNRKNILQYPCGICRASLSWSANARGTKEYTWPTNWWI